MEREKLNNVACYQLIKPSSSWPLSPFLEPWEPHALSWKFLLWKCEELWGVRYLSGRHVRETTCVSFRSVWHGVNPCQAQEAGNLSSVPSFSASWMARGGVRKSAAGPLPLGLTPVPARLPGNALVRLCQAKYSKQICSLTELPYMVNSISIHPIAQPKTRNHLPLCLLFPTSHL